MVLAPAPDLAYVRWTWCRAALHRGWWLVTAVYLVVDARLSPAQLVLVGVGQGAVALVCEVPAGVVADTLGRTRSLLVSHLLMGAAMVVTALVTGFPALLATQMVWGLAWTFASGADIAWITDELAEPARTATVLVRAARADLTGAVAGMAGLAVLARLAGRPAAMVLAGVAMLLLGGYVAARFRERRFVPAAAGARWSTARSTLRAGVGLARGSRVVLVLLAATFLVNGVAGTAGRLYPLRLVEVGPVGDPVVVLAVLGVLALLAGAAALRMAQPRVAGTHAVRRGYLAACAVAATGLALLAVAAEPLAAGAGLLLAAAALPLPRAFGAIWVNRHATGAVRATVHSLLAQAEYLGAIACGVAAAALAGAAAALLGCAALLLVACALVRRTPA